MKKSFSLVQKLKSSGIKCKVEHYRWVIKNLDDHELSHVTQQNLKEFTFIESNGGQTKVYLTFPDGKNYESCANCSLLDTYCRRTGIQICVNRIMAQRKLDKKFSIERRFRSTTNPQDIIDNLNKRIKELEVQVLEKLDK
jgi:hypothetical protein